MPSVGFRSWSRFLAASLQVTWVINSAVDCHYFPQGLQLPSQPLKGLLPILLFGEQRQNGCEQFAEDCYPTPTASRLQFEPRPFCAWVQHYNYSATEPPSHLLSFNSTALPCIHRFPIPTPISSIAYPVQLTPPGDCPCLTSFLAACRLPSFSLPI